MSEETPEEKSKEPEKEIEKSNSMPKKTQRKPARKKVTVQKDEHKQIQPDQDPIDQFLGENSNLSEEALIKKFCRERGKKYLLRSDWSVVSSDYRLSGNIRDLLEFFDRSGERLKDF